MTTSATDKPDPQWVIEYLDCGHFVAFPVNNPNEQPHLIYEGEPLQECCIKAMSKELVHNG